MAGEDGEGASGIYWVTLENRAWPYDYPATVFEVKADSEAGARIAAEKIDQFAEVLSVVRIGDDTSREGR